MGRYLKVYSKLTPQEIRQLEYKEKYKKINPSWDDSLIWLCKIFEPHIVPKMKVLDAGCGHGNLVIDEFRTRISKAIGVDVDKNATKKNVCLDEVIIANLENLPFKKDSFDVVIGQWVFEHLSRPRVAFQEVHRVLKKGGAFIFVTPNKYSYLIMLKKIFAVFPGLANSLFGRLYGRKEDEIFKTYYLANTQSDLEKLLEASGFKKKLLFYNGDPSYIAFNDLLFYLGVVIDKLPRLTSYYFSKPHLVGVFLK